MEKCTRSTWNQSQIQHNSALESEISREYLFFQILATMDVLKDKGFSY